MTYTKKRGKLLTFTYGLFVILFAIQIAYVFSSGASYYTYIRGNEVLFSIFFIVWVFQLISLWFTYHWHKWGLYCLLAGMIIKVIDTVTAPRTHVLAGYLFTACIAMLLLFAVHRKWEYFA